MNIVDAARKTAANIRAYSLELARSDIESALVVADSYGSFLSSNHIGMFADIEFEEHFSSYLSFLIEGQTKNVKLEVLHLMTTPYAYGGHTRVVEKFLCKGFGDGFAALDKLPNQVLERIPNNVIIYESIRQNSGIDTIRKILEIGLEFKFVILHIHQNDIYSAVAASLLAKLGVTIYFYNHADHCFSFGYFAAEKVLEISKYGWLIGVSRGITKKQSFVGIPIQLHNPVKESILDKQMLNGLLAGSSGKFRPFGDYSVPIFLNKFFENEYNSKKIKFYICGPTGKEAYWRVLDKNAISNIIFLGQLNYNEYTKLMSNSDFYLDSFPYVNATGFVEAVMLGIPSFGVNLFAGYSSADILRSRSVCELIQHLQSFFLDQKKYNQLMLDVRDSVICNQSIDACIDRVRVLMQGGDNISLLPCLGNMECVENFFEKSWKSDNRIILPVRMLSNLTFFQILKFMSSWVDIWPYTSTFVFLKDSLVKFGKYLYLEKLTR